MTRTDNELIGWEVFYIVDLYDVGKTEHQSMRHGTRAEARDQMRKMKAQPWAFKTVFMTRVTWDHTNGRTVWSKVR